ncbi:MAG: hypothetical protein KDC34_00995 [Saprospiraceae bacterium]|nr:hypothetical protein [Saprospiraceae bacterium]
MHSTNYYNTFIEIAEDCPTDSGIMPPLKGDKLSVANMQFELIYENPYKYSSDDVLFTVFANRKELIADEREEARQQFFSKGQPCFRASPLTKRYGWGLHSNAAGKIALYSAESEAYEGFVNDPSIKKVKAMRSSRK